MDLLVDDVDAISNMLAVGRKLSQFMINMLLLLLAPFLSFVLALQLVKAPLQLKMCFANCYFSAQQNDEWTEFDTMELFSLTHLLEE